MTGKTTFTNRIRVGQDVGNTTKDTLSEVHLVKRIQFTNSTVTSAALPANADLVGKPWLTMTSAFSVSAGTTLSLGIPGNINKYATLVGLNAVQATVMNTSAANMRGLGGDILISVTAASGANPTAGGGVLYIPYVITQNA